MAFVPLVAYRLECLGSVCIFAFTNGLYDSACFLARLSNRVETRRTYRLPLESFLFWWTHGDGKGAVLFVDANIVSRQLRIGHRVGFVIRLEVGNHRVGESLAGCHAILPLASCQLDRLGYHAS